MNYTRRTFLKTGVYLLPGLAGLSCGGGGGSSKTNTVSDSTPPQETTDVTQLVAPSIISQPQDQIVNSGSTAVFQVLAEGSEPLTFQWIRDGSPIPDATSSTYTTEPVHTGYTAQYAVLIYNSQGAVQSRNALLQVSSANLTVDSTTFTIDSTSWTIDLI